MNSIIIAAERKRGKTSNRRGKRGGGISLKVVFTCGEADRSKDPVGVVVVVVVPGQSSLIFFCQNGSYAFPFILPNQQRSLNKLPTELRCRNFGNKCHMSIQVGTRRVHAVHILTELPFCVPPLVVGYDHY